MNVFSRLHTVLNYLGYLLLAILMIAFIAIYSIAEVTREFDNKIDTQLIHIDSNLLGLNSVGHPAHTDFAEVPWGYYGIVMHPRKWEIKGCTEITLPKGMNSLSAATSAPEELAAQINIQMPLSDGQTINICGPETVTFDLYLWTY